MPMQIRRTATVNAPPTGLAEGQLAVEMANVVRPDLWVGVPTAIDASGRRRVNSVAVVSNVAPTNPNIGDLWWDTDDGQMYVWSGNEWVIVVNQAGPQGPQGPQGIPGTPGTNGTNGLNGGVFPDVAIPGVFLREAGDWVPMLVLTSTATALVNIPASTWTDGVGINVGTTGTWFVTSTFSAYRSGAVMACAFRLWDGTTVMADVLAHGVADYQIPITLSGVITNPAATIRISGNGNGAPAIIGFNTWAGTWPNAARITAVRIG